MKTFNSLYDFKVGLFYEKDKPYLSLEGKTKDNKAEINLFKIDLTNLVINTDVANIYDDVRFLPIKTLKDYSVTFPLKTNENDVAYTVKFDDRKEMTKEQIEKELGYKIKIKD